MHGPGRRPSRLATLAPQGDGREVSYRRIEAMRMADNRRPPLHFLPGRSMLADQSRGQGVLHNPGVTEGLAKFVVDARWDDLPPQVTHQAKRSLMNFFAVALTGCRDPIFETMLATLAAFSGGKQATLIGRRERIDALNAAFLNAAGANVLDFCD